MCPAIIKMKSTRANEWLLLPRWWWSRFLFVFSGRCLVFADNKKLENIDNKSERAHNVNIFSGGKDCKRKTTKGEHAKIALHLIKTHYFYDVSIGGYDERYVHHLLHFPTNKLFAMIIVIILRKAIRIVARSCVCFYNSAGATAIHQYFDTIYPGMGCFMWCNIHYFFSKAVRMYFTRAAPFSCVLSTWTNESSCLLPWSWLQAEENTLSQEIDRRTVDGLHVCIRCKLTNERTESILGSQISGIQMFISNVLFAN